MGIVGLPNVGKSTLFNALTKKSVPAENYPFCTIDPSVGIVPVPDDRLWKLSEFSKSAKTIPAVIEFVDIAGLVAGASKGEGLGNKFLTNIREVDAIAHIVRVFEDPSVIHVANKIDPMNDIGVINLELVLSDMETVSKRIANLVRDVKKGEKEAILEETILKKVEEVLEKGKMATEANLSDDEKLKIKSMNLLTLKPMLYVLNTSEANENVEIEAPGLSVKIDSVFEKGFDDLIKQSYKLLGLETYFTTGEDESRAWTIKIGSTAPVAGSAIHTDFEEKFIRADVINWQRLLDAGSYVNARAKGLVATVGKDYIVKDGDVIEFKI
ncbi:MAG: redox-regulated ATPase YchF [Candidatus Paceibacterota bacterium]